MSADLAHRLTVLTACVVLLCVALIVGGKLWIASARKDGNRKLSFPQRFALALLLACMVPAWWLVDQTLQQLSVAFTRGARHDISDQLDIPMPIRTSFDVPQWRMIGERRVLLLQTPARVEWDLHQPAAAVTFEYGFDPAAYEKGKTNGADVTLELSGKHGVREIFRRRLDPRRKPEDRGLQTSAIVIPAYEEGAKLILLTDPGDGGDTAWDWVCLSRLKTSAGNEYTAKQYPNFNRAPLRTEGDNSAVFYSAEGKPYLLLAAPSVLTFALTGTERTITLDFGFLPSAYTNGGKTDGAIFRLEVVSQDGPRTSIFERKLTPLETIADRELQHAVIPFPKISSTDTLALSIFPGANNGWDHTYVSLFKLE